MATWVTFPKALTFSAVKNKYKRTSQFLKAVRVEALGSASWARRKTSTRGESNLEVDVTAIPLVRPMRPSGSLKS